MKRRRIALLLVVVILVAIGLAVFFFTGRGRFASAADCLLAFREAKVQANAEEYLQCLSGDLQARALEEHGDRQGLEHWLKQQAAGMQGWVELGTIAHAGSAIIDVEEVHSAGKKVTRYQIEEAENGWIIVLIKPIRDIPNPIPLGTPVGKEPKEKK